MSNIEPFNVAHAKRQAWKQGVLQHPLTHLLT